MSKKVNLKPNAAPRFHGAFTGGFSAGYFNTVGSEEGFQPKAFISSREKRSFGQSNVTDFMDDEDGILGGKLTSKKVFNNKYNR
jgi:G patch domain-containing protein 1